MPSQKLIAVLVEASLKGEGFEAATVELPAIKEVEEVDSREVNKTHPAAQTRQLSRPLQGGADDGVAQGRQPEAPLQGGTDEAATTTTPPDGFDGEIKLDDINQKLKDMDELSAFALMEFAQLRYSKQSNTLTLFFAKKFHRTKAEEPKFRDTMAAAVESLYHFRPSIIISKQAAPADSDASKVMELMGGGEVVTNAKI